MANSAVAEPAQAEVAAWQPPAFYVSDSANLVVSSSADFSKWSGNFFRSAKWCSDGTAVLAQCEDHSLNIYDALVHQHSIRQPAPVLEYLWYPSASALNPPSFCFLASTRESPVKLIDASSKTLRASYRIVDHRERQIAPHSMAFDPTATHLYCGFENAIEVFDFQRPGEGTRLHTTPSRKSRDGLKGIISSIAFCPDWSEVYAASSLSSGIALFSADTGGQVLNFLGDSIGATTQVLFNPARPHELFASARRRDEIRMWDIRNPSEPLKDFKRPGFTNQKLRFDIDLSGKWLAAGDTKGHIHFFDLTDENNESVSHSSFAAGTDAIGSVQFHSQEPLLLSASGTRHFEGSIDGRESEYEIDSSDDESPESQSNAGIVPDTSTSLSPTAIQSHLKIWSMRDSRNDSEAPRINDNVHG